MISSIERFEEKFMPEPVSGCWLWTAYCAPSGYGQFRDGAQQLRAHRWSYEYHVGPIPEGLVIDHLCRNRSCVNPAHLEPVTVTENIKRGDTGKYQIYRTHCPQGHEYAGDNLIIEANGARKCKTCKNKIYKKWKEKSHSNCQNE